MSHFWLQGPLRADPGEDIVRWEFGWGGTSVKNNAGVLRGLIENRKSRVEQKGKSPLI